MFSMPTSGPLSPTVSLERRKLENAGVQPGQEQQGAADIGSPISGDLAQLIQLNRMLQQQGGAQQQANAAPSTVAQDLMQLAMQKRAPQMAAPMPQLKPPMQAQPQADPRQQGIAQLPQEAVGTKAMASGGIVAFDEGGDVRHFDGLDGSLVGGLLDPGYGQDNALTEELRRRSNEEMEAKRQAALAAIAARARAVNPIGQNKSVLNPPAPTETAPSESDILLAKMKKRAEAGADIYAADRAEMEKKYGYTGAIEAQEAENARRMKELSPEEQRKAMLRNFAANVASKIGQPRTVSRGSGIAQILGAYSTASAETKDDFKKRTAELNAAANALKERQAIYRMTGAASDAAKMEQAQKDYAAAVHEKDAVNRQIAADALANRRLDQQGNRDAQRLQLERDREKREAKYQEVMADVASGKVNQVELRTLANNLTSQLNSITSLQKMAELPEEKASLNAERIAISQQLSDVQSHIKRSLGMPAASTAPTGGNTVKWGALK